MSRQDVRGAWVCACVCSKPMAYVHYLIAYNIESLIDHNIASDVRRLIITLQHHLQCPIATQRSQVIVLPYIKEPLASYYPISTKSKF